MSHCLWWAKIRHIGFLRNKREIFLCSLAFPEDIYFGGPIYIYIYIARRSSRSRRGFEPHHRQVKSTSLFLLYNFSDVLASEMILGRNICWSLYIFNIIYYFQASVSIRSRYSLYIDDCVSTTKSNNPIRRVMQRNQA